MCSHLYNRIKFSKLNRIVLSYITYKGVASQLLSDIESVLKYSFSNGNKTPIRYIIRDATKSYTVWCDHGLKRLKRKNFSALRQKQSCSHEIANGFKNLKLFSFKPLKPFWLSSEKDLTNFMYKELFIPAVIYLFKVNNRKVEQN